MKNVVARRGVHTADRLVEKIQLCLAAHDEDELHLFARAFGHLLDLLLRLDAEPLPVAERENREETAAEEETFEEAAQSEEESKPVQPEEKEEPAETGDNEQGEQA